MNGVSNLVIHHMSDGSIRDSVDGMVIPKKFESIYILAREIRVRRIENGSKKRTIEEEQILG